MKLLDIQRRFFPESDSEYAQEFYEFCHGYLWLVADSPDDYLDHLDIEPVKDGLVVTLSDDFIRICGTIVFWAAP